MAQDFQILLYYRYNPIPNAEAFVEEHRAFCAKLGLKGRILIGSEGINGTVSGPTLATEQYMEAMRADERMSGMEFKVDPADGHVFPKLSVKFREEIVTLGLEEKEDIDPNQITGKHLTPSEWKEAIEGEDVIILDGRNNYESAVGHFKGALCPDVKNFRDFPEWIRTNLDDQKEKKILTYCTGGIRCEKLSGLLVQQGFTDVSQLHGGIVEYGKNEETKGEHFEGLCYVFDERIAVESNFTKSRKVVSHCTKCDQPSPRYRNCAWAKCNRQFFLCEPCEESKNRFCSDECEAGFSFDAE